MSNRDEQLDALATAISELHSYNGNEQAAAAYAAFDAVADMLAEKSKALEKAERERDEARAALEEAKALRADDVIAELKRRGFDLSEVTTLVEQHAQAVALLPEAQHLLSCDGRYALVCDCPGCLMRKRIDAFLAGQPAPGVKPVVDDALVERARKGEGEG